MVTEAARGPLANTLAVAATGQGLMLAGSLLARAVADLPAHQLDGVSFGTFYGVLGIGAGLSWWYSQRLKRGSRQPLRSTAAVAVEPGTVADATAAPSTATEVALPSDPFVTRLQQVIAGQDFAITHPLVQDDAGEYIQFNVRATKPGLFANDRTRSNVYNLLTNSVGGHWNYRSDPATDTLTFTRKAGFPAVVTPPVPNRIPQSTDEARQMYPDFRMRLGVTSSGEVLEINMAKFPHALFVGGSGSGKSVFARAVIESFRVAGWMIFLGDGKGTDYEGLHRQPGVVAISQSTADHIRMVRMVAEELRGRQADTQKRQRAGEQDAFRRPPLLLLLDEYATMLADIKSEYGAEAFESDLKFLTRVGRQFKVHVIFSTQEAYRDTINGQLLGNIGLRVSLGPPEDKTIKEVFPEKLRNEAARIGGTISKNDRGRGLALMTADDGTAQAVEFQSFYGYSPPSPIRHPPPRSTRRGGATRPRPAIGSPRSTPGSGSRSTARTTPLSSSPFSPCARSASPVRTAPPARGTRSTIRSRTTISEAPQPRARCSRRSTSWTTRTMCHRHSHLRVRAVRAMGTVLSSTTSAGLPRTQFRRRTRRRHPQQALPTSLPPMSPPWTMPPTRSSRPNRQPRNNDAVNASRRDGSRASETHRHRRGRAGEQPPTRPRFRALVV
ncbi:hypothetical protein GS489_31050 [Rhodococcus hoagii]|nr:hypothetical protein [Prescottella equi]